MLKLLVAVLVGSAIAQVVDLNSYLTFSTPHLASQRSQQMCAAVNCKPPTRCWWSVMVLSDGSAALRIQPSGIYSMSASGVGACAVGCGLTTTEIGLLKTAVQLGSNMTSTGILDCP